MAALREIFATFGVQFDDRQLKRGAAQTQALTNKVRELGRFLAVGFIVRGAARFVSSTIAMGDELDKTARQLGLTTTELQAFSHAASLGGVDSAAFAMSVGQLQRNAHMASQGTGEAADAFRDLGVEFQDTNGELLSGADLMRNVADGLQNTSNSSTRTALAMMLMGRSGRRLLPMLEGGSEGLSTMTAELERLGGGASQDFIDQSVEVTDNIARWRLAMQSFKSTMLLQFMPGLNRVVEKVTEWTAAFSSNQGAMRGLKALLIAVGVIAVVVAGKMVLAWIAAGWPILLVVAAVGVLALALDDLWVTWQGGESVTRDFINTIWPGMVDGLDSTDRAIYGVIASFSVFMQHIEGVGLIADGVFRGIGAAATSMVLVVQASIAALGSMLSGGGITGAVGAAQRVANQRNEEGRTIGGTFSQVRENLSRGFSNLTTGHQGATARAVQQSVAPERFQSFIAERTARAPAAKVDARQTVSVVINEASDAAEVERRVDHAIRAENDRQARAIGAALVPATGET